MWVDTTALQTQEERFIAECIMLGSKYNVVVDIDYVNNIINFLTEDETIINTIAFELEEKFG